MTAVREALVLPFAFLTVALLGGIGAACWYVARTPLTADLSDRLQTWALAGAMLLLFVAISFGWLYRDVMQPRFADRYATASASADSGPSTRRQGTMMRCSCAPAHST